jgi:hypothetical protein
VGGQYFGGRPSDSLGYCRGGHKMIIFAVLMDDSGLTFQGAGGAHSEVPICACMLSMDSMVHSCCCRPSPLPLHSPSTVTGTSTYKHTAASSKEALLKHFCLLSHNVCAGDCHQQVPSPRPNRCCHVQRPLLSLYSSPCYTEFQPRGSGGSGGSGSSEAQSVRTSASGSCGCCRL